MNIMHIIHRTFLFSALFCVSSLLVGALETPFPISDTPSAGARYMLSALKAIRQKDRKHAYDFLVEAALHDHELACRYLARCFGSDKSFFTRQNPIMKKLFEDLANSISVLTPQTQRKLNSFDNYVSDYLNGFTHGNMRVINHVPLLSSDLSLTGIICLFAVGRITEEEFTASICWTDQDSYQKMWDFLIQRCHDSSITVDLTRFHRLVIFVKDWALANGNRKEWIELFSKDFSQLWRAQDINVLMAEKKSLLNLLVSSLDEDAYGYQPSEDMASRLVQLVNAYLPLMNEGDKPKDLISLLSFVRIRNTQFYSQMAQWLVREKVDLLMKWALDDPCSWDLVEGTSLSLKNLIEYSFLMKDSSPVAQRALARFFKTGSALHEQYQYKIVNVIKACGVNTRLADMLKISVLKESKIPLIRFAMKEVVIATKW